MTNVAYDEVDDTDMTAAQFRAAARRGYPVRVVASRAEYEAELRKLADMAAPRGFNLQINLARVITSSQNELARASC